jgi:hypothetical protein
MRWVNNHELLVDTDLENNLFLCVFRPHSAEGTEQSKENLRQMTGNRPRFEMNIM